MNGHKPVTDAGLLFGSIFVAVAFVGIGILGGQSGSVQMAQTSPVAMDAAAAPAASSGTGTTAAKSCNEKKNVSNALEVQCESGCTYKITPGGFFSSPVVTPTGTVDSTGKQPAKIVYDNGMIGANPGGSTGNTFHEVNCPVGTKIGAAADSFIKAALGTSPVMAAPAAASAATPPASTPGNGTYAGQPSIPTTQSGATTQFQPCPGSNNAGDIQCYVQNGTQYTYSKQDWLDAGGTLQNLPGAPGSAIAPDNSLVGGPTSAAVPGASPAMTQSDIAQLQNAPVPSGGNAGVPATPKLNPAMNNGSVGDITSSPVNPNLFYGLGTTMEGDADQAAPTDASQIPQPSVSGSGAGGVAPGEPEVPSSAPSQTGGTQGSPVVGSSGQTNTGSTVSSPWTCNSSVECATKSPPPAPLPPSGPNINAGVRDCYRLGGQIPYWSLDAMFGKTFGYCQ